MPFPEIAHALLDGVIVILAVTYVMSRCEGYFKGYIWLWDLIFGLLLGGAAVNAMLNAAQLSPGVLFDARAIVIGMAAAFGGPLVAGVTASAALIVRIFLGGPGAVPGVMLALISLAIGLGYWHLRRTGRLKGSLLSYAAFGFALALGHLACGLLLPRDLIGPFFEQATIPTLVVHPLSTILLCYILNDSFVREGLVTRLGAVEGAFSSQFSESPLPQMTFDARDGSILASNRAFQSLSGYKAKDLNRRPISDFLDQPNSAGLSVKDLIEGCRAGEDVLGEEFCIHTEDGSCKYVMLTVSAVGSNIRNIREGRCVFADLTRIKVSEQREMRMARLRQTIAECHSALLRIDDEDALLQEMCDILVKERDYALVWIGVPQKDAGKTVKPAASAGEAVDYLKDIKVSWDDGVFGDGPTGRAIRFRQEQVIREVADAPNYRPWKTLAATKEFHSSAALPLTDGTTVFGALNVYSTVPDLFDEDEVSALREFSTDLAFGIKAIRATKEQERIEHSLTDAFLGTIMAVSRTMEKRDPYTAGHQARVALLAVEIAKHLGWDEYRIEGLRLGALIHDIGKIYVPAEILSRPGRLNEYEYEIVKTHTSVGYDILSRVNFPWPVADMVLQHHERLDGTGYPNGLKGDEIIEEAKIIGVADVMEAISSHRPYRAAVGQVAALEELHAGAGIRYDAHIVAACEAVVKRPEFKWDVPTDA